MSDIQDKLNKSHTIQMQGGSIMLILKLLLDKQCGMESALILAEKLNMDIDPKMVADAKEMLRAVNAIGCNLMCDARDIFGEAYLEDMFSGNEGIVPDGGTEVPKDAVFN